MNNNTTDELRVSPKLSQLGHQLTERQLDNSSFRFTNVRHVKSNSASADRRPRILIGWIISREMRD